MHHYCAGLMKMNRALFLAKDNTTRRFYFADAITEIDYVMRHESCGVRRPAKLAARRPDRRARECGRSSG